MPGKIESELRGVRGIERTSEEFRAKLFEVADRLGASARDLACVISFETGHTFSPSQRSRSSEAVGLIQFLPSTCREMGISAREMASLSAERQLDYVERYLRDHSRGKPLDSARDLYMAVLWPKAVGRGDNFQILNGSKDDYRQNRGLDLNHDRRITALEATEKMLDAALEPRARSASRVEQAPDREERHSNWKADLAIIGARFALEYIMSAREGHDPDRRAHSEQMWRAFTALAEIPEVRGRLREMTTLDGPDLVRSVQSIVEAHRGIECERPAPTPGENIRPRDESMQL